MLRAALFAGVGILFCALWVVFDPGYGVSASQRDLNLVLGFSAALAGLAVALPLFAQLAGERRIVRVSLVPAAGAAAASVVNVVEDGFAVESAFFGFVASSAILAGGLLVMTATTAFAGRGAHRLLALVPAATLAGIAFYVAAGGIVLLAAWLAAAVYAAASPRS